jgi:hypothetical protein
MESIAYAFPSAAVVVCALLAWDFGRRWMVTRSDAGRLVRLEADYAAKIKALEVWMLGTDKALHKLQGQNDAAISAVAAGAVGRFNPRAVQQR